MGRFWNALLLVSLGFGVISCQEADFYKKPELISNDFKDRYYHPNDGSQQDDHNQDRSHDGGDNGGGAPVVDNPPAAGGNGGGTPVVDNPPAAGGNGGGAPVVDNPPADGGNGGGTPVVDNPPADGGNGGGTPVVDNPPADEGNDGGTPVVDNPPADEGNDGGTPVVDNPPADDAGDDSVNEESVVKLEPVVEIFKQAEEQKAKVDILWVVDNSGSMGNEQNSLAYNFDIFIREFLKQDIDFKMGITTTDIKRDLGKDYKNSSILLTAARAAQNKEKFINDFKRLIKVGTRGYNREQGLRTMAAYLDNQHRMRNFMRPDAYLVVVIISDEEEQSPYSAGKYIKFLKSLKQHDGWVKVYSIVTKKPRHRYETVGRKYMEVSKATNGKIIDIQDDFYNSLEDMGISIVDLTKSFALGKKPYDASSIIVKVNGDVATGWSYDANSNAIVFADDSTPKAGSNIEVNFDILME